MKLTVFAALASCLAVAIAYPIIGDTVNCRFGPGTSYDVKKTYQKSQDVEITCQTTGTNVSGNNLWDKTQDGCYVSDYYVKTGVDGYVAPKCGSSGGSSCSAPKSNAATVNLIAEFEGFRADVYKDPVGNPTVGYGHLCTLTGCKEVKYPIPLSKTDGKKLLADDMSPKEKCLKNMLKSKAVLNANQYGALVSWTFNMGCGAAEDSTLVKRLNDGESPNTVISEELPKWVHAGGNVLDGLVRRRNAEIKLAKTATSTKALPFQC